MDDTNGLDDTNELQSERDPRWGALTLGTLSPGEEGDLRRAAPDLYARCRPLDPARMADRVEAALAARAERPQLAERPRERERSRLVLMFALTTGVVVPGIVAAVVYAPTIMSSAGGPPLYAMSMPRGGGSGLPNLSTPDARLEAALTPIGRIQGPVAFRGALLIHPESGRAQPWHLQLQPTRRNEFFLSGTRAELFPGVPSGEWDMLIAVGRPGSPLSEDELRSLADKGLNGDHQVLKQRVVLKGPCVPSADMPCPEGGP